jgi:hypothetical protein
MAEERQYYHRWANLEKDLNVMRLVCLILTAALLLAVLAIILLAGRRQIIVAVDGDGSRSLLAQAAGENPTEGFISEMLLTLYNWDCITAASAYSRASRLLSTDLGSKLVRTFDTQLAACIENEKLSCTLILDKLTYLSGNDWHASGIKHLRGRTTDARRRVGFSVSVAETRISEENVWGLIVTRLVEEEVTS